MIRSLTREINELHLRQPEGDEINTFRQESSATCDEEERFQSREGRTTERNLLDSP